MKIVLDIPAQKIADLMVTAIEGNYMTRAWCNGVFLIKPKSYEKSIDIKDTSPWYSKGGVYEKSFEICVEEIIDESKHASGSNIKKHTVGSVQMAEAFRLMSEQYGWHFGNFMSDDYDTVTADVFLQLAALGEVIYG